MFRKGKIKMKQSSISMLAFAAYMAAFGVVFVFFPNPVITLLGFEKVGDVWIRILGYVLGALAFYYVMAVREEATNFYRWTVYGRTPLLLFYIAFVLFGIAPPILILIGVIESGSGVWTALALRSEKSH